MPQDQIVITELADYAASLERRLLDLEVGLEEIVKEGCEKKRFNFRNTCSHSTKHLWCTSCKVRALLDRVS